MPQDLVDELVNICSSNGLVLPGNKPLPEPVLLDHNELTKNFNAHAYDFIYKI